MPTSLPMNVVPKHFRGECGFPMLSSRWVTTGTEKGRAHTTRLKRIMERVTHLFGPGCGCIESSDALVSRRPHESWHRPSVDGATSYPQILFRNVWKAVGTGGAIGHRPDCSSFSSFHFLLVLPSLVFCACHSQVPEASAGTAFWAVVAFDYAFSALPSVILIRVVLSSRARFEARVIGW